LINRTFACMVMALFFFTGLALGGFDLSASAGVVNFSTSDTAVQGLFTNEGSALADALAPQTTATDPGTEMAFYTQQPPTKTDQKTLLPFNVKASPSTYVFYKGSYLGWSGFTSQFPNTSPGLWIERSVSWSWYATMPLGGWARELLYVPAASPVSMYEIYPGGYVTKYDLGFVKPGYYYIWYYADTPGRHLDVLGVSGGYSNMVVIDVYTISVPKPTPPKPDPKKECENRPTCHWSDAYQQCYCTGFIPENPEKQKCEQKSYCSWVNGQCLCTMPNPDDQERVKCEQNPDCDWIDGQCICRNEPMPGPVPNPNPEPMPGPVPNPNPEPTPGPSPAEICQQNPGCYWANGQCLCTGAGGDNVGGGLSGDNPETVP
jgi:hypothetical protein